MLIRGAQMGNHYTRTLGRQNILGQKSMVQSNVFTKYGINSAIFKPRADFLQFVNTKKPTLLFSGALGLFLKR